MADVPMEGNLALATQRGPDFFALYRLQRGQHFLFVDEAKDNSGRLAGMGGILVRSGWLDGVTMPVGYLGDLRTRGFVRERVAFPQVYAHFFHQTAQQTGCDHYLTAILADNAAAARALTEPSTLLSAVTTRTEPARAERSQPVLVNTDSAPASTTTTTTTTTTTATSPSVPVGWLKTGSTTVLAGTKTPLSWGITHPSVVTDHVTITETNTVTTDEELDVEVRVLGAGVTVSNSNGSNLSFVPTEATMRIAGGSYNRIFYGTNKDVKPGKVVYSGTLNKATSLRFGGRYYYNGAWGTNYTSSSGTNNVRTLVNGETPPTTYPLINAPTLENFIKPYLDSTGKVKIGPMDVIVFMELTHTDAQRYNQGYDLQDMVLLVTFKTR